MKNFIVTVALLASAAVAQASPVQYNFTYATSAGTLAGSLMGELQANQNTIVVSSVLDFAKFNGVAGPSLPWVSSITTPFGGPFQFATTSLDGSVQDLFAATANVSEGFALVKGVAGAGNFDNVFASSPGFGNRHEAYAAANWSITSAATVPEPTSLALSLTALGLLGALRLRRRARG